MWFKSRAHKKLEKVFNGSVHQYNPPKPPSNRTVQEICNTASMPHWVDTDQIIRDIRKK